ncbi:MAG: helix-turn-helix transcriptional regulator [Lentisphaeria bacterium]|nr:helix-turn-helix transcriptional regulator [Lentisphaeria bacterium]
MSREVLHAGKFISRGKGRHATRVMESHELIVVLSGELNMFEEEHYFKIRSGEYLFLHRGRRHGGIGNYPGNLSFFWLHFRDDHLLAELPQSGELPPHSLLPGYAQMFLLEQGRNEPDKESLSLLFELMIKELRRSPVNRSETVTTPLADMARRYLLTHFTEQLSLASISRELHCNAKYLGQLYHRIYGETIITTLNRLRIEQACNMMITGNLSIKETAENCGFNDMAYFRRQFVKYCNMTPRDFIWQKLAGFHNTDSGGRVNIGNPERAVPDADR